MYTHMYREITWSKIIGHGRGTMIYTQAWVVTDILLWVTRGTISPSHTNGEWHSIKVIILELKLLCVIAPLEGHFFICIVKRHLILAKYGVQMKMTLTLNKLDVFLWMEMVKKNYEFIKNT